MSAIVPHSQPNGLFQSRWKKSVLYGLTFLVAFIIALRMYFDHQGGGDSDPLGFVITLVGGALCFPLGLAYFSVPVLELTGNQDVDLYTVFAAISIVGWILYTSLFFGLIFFQKRSIVILLYLIFVALLITNVIGCQAFST